MILVAIGVFNAKFNMLLNAVTDTPIVSAITCASNIEYQSHCQKIGNDIALTYM